ncbi:hypothetical protein T08_4150 [Trichinella sp. T8]|nr:hypothetical protein T08_7474 [Trichinella sp. T8]KRZ64152.1 hypothetical protein T08_4150 [Trichinella sp. T8]
MKISCRIYIEPSRKIPYTEVQNFISNTFQNLP